MCKEWDDYMVFKQWAESNGYEDCLEIDRIDNDGNYCPENCRWADNNTQAVNTTRKRASSFRGVRINNGYYHAYLRKDGVIHHGGYYKNEYDAIKERIEMEIKYLGRAIA